MKKIYSHSKYTRIEQYKTLNLPMDYEQPRVVALSPSPASWRGSPRRRPWCGSSRRPRGTWARS
uniref:Uncharacterized protein n=1 Tax=Arundo donax TaxID=35708 RepID=A0A0A9DN96_ARUDO